MMQQNGKSPERVALYARVSTEDQAERQTIQAQLRFLHDYCKLYDLPIAGQFEDDGISGTVPLSSRPQGMRLLEAASAHAFSTVLIYRLDRLGRKLSVILDAHEELERQGVDVRSGTEPIDTSTPVGRFIFQLLGSIAELEKATIAQRMIDGKNTKAIAGKWLGGVIPTGYDVDPDGHLIPSERPVEQLGKTEAELVVELFERIASGSSTLEEARRLNALGVSSVRRYNGKEKVVSELWGSSKVLSILKNRAYTGLHVYNGRGGAIERQVPALISPALFEAAQRQLTSNRTLAKRNAEHNYLLRAKITCANCGAHFTGLVGGQNSEGYDGHRYYRCRTQVNRVTAGRTCDAKLLNADWLEGLVWEHIHAFAMDPGEPLEEAKRELRSRLEKTAGIDEQRRVYLAQLAEKEAEKERILTLFRRGTIGLVDAESQLGKIDGEAASIRQMIEAIRSQSDLTASYETQIANTAALLLELRGKLDEIETDCESEDPEVRASGLRAKADVIADLVSGIKAETIVVEAAGEARRRNKKRVQVTIRYSFGQSFVTDASTIERAGTRCLPESHPGQRGRQV